MMAKSRIAAFCMLGISVIAASPASAVTDPTAAGRPARVVLIGASIGMRWDLPDLPARLHRSGYQFEALQVWEYDKSPMVEEVLMRPSRKFHFTRTYFTGFFGPSPQPPDIVVLKECSSYFPGDLSPTRKRELLQQWVRELQQKQIRVVLATAVPVTKKRSIQDPGKQEALLAFNDWVRGFAQKNAIPLLDLEAALRTDETNRYLREEFAQEDGSHLNRKAYDVLDPVMWQTVCSTSPTEGCR